jgi:cell division protease FtsH
MSRQEILDRIVVLLGGRVAEARTFGDVSTGAQDDLVQATDIARRMVKEFGMGEAMGLISFDPRKQASFGERNDYSEETARAVDAEVSRILVASEARTKALLNEHADALERVARRLLEVETMTGADIRELLHHDAPPVSGAHPVGTHAGEPRIEVPEAAVAGLDVDVTALPPRAAIR